MTINQAFGWILRFRFVALQQQDTGTDLSNSIKEELLGISKDYQGALTIMV